MFQNKFLIFFKVKMNLTPTIPLTVQMHSGAGSPMKETGTLKAWPTLIRIGFKSLSIILGLTETINHT